MSSSSLLRKLHIAPIMPLVTQNAVGKRCSVTQSSDRKTYSLPIINLSYQQVKTLLGRSRNPAAKDGNTTKTKTTNARSNNTTSKIDSVKTNLCPLLFNNQHVRFSKVEEFKLDFNSFVLTRGHFGGVLARTPLNFNFLPSLAQISELAPAGGPKVEFMWAIWSKITIASQTAGHQMGPHHTDPVGCMQRGICKKIYAANALKTRNASSVLMKIKYIMESSFPDAHDWVNNTRVGVRERDGQVTFEDAVKKKALSTSI
jgi:hypothetical protein